MKANEFLEQGIAEMKDREAAYDAPGGERSMARTVAAFNAFTGRGLTEADGWLFMQCLKVSRSLQGDFKADNHVDGAAYEALRGECMAEGSPYCDKGPHDASTGRGKPSCLHTGCSNHAPEGVALCDEHAEQWVRTGTQGPLKPGFAFCSNSACSRVLSTQAERCAYCSTEQVIPVDKTVNGAYAAEAENKPKELP